MQATKTALRQQFKAFRASMTPEDRESRAQSIMARLAELPEVRAARIIHTYWPSDLHQEIALKPLIRAWWAAGKILVFPVMDASAADGLRHVACAQESDLVPNAWGIEEPVCGQDVSPSDVQLVLAPCLAADRRGFRLGYGKGYYDRFLKQIQVPVVTAVFQPALVAELPVDLHDIPVQILISDEETLRFL